MFSADLGGVAASSTPSSNDPPFQKVALLLHGDGTNGAQNNTFLDSSTNNFTITRTGNVAQGTFSPFSLADGQWSNYIPSASATCLKAGTSTSLALGSGDFTVEIWVYINALAPNYTTLFDWRTNGSTPANIPVIGDTANNGTLSLWCAGTTLVTSSITIPLKQWVHVAVVRSSTTITIYFNGVSVGSTTSSINFGVETLNIGSPQASNYNPNAYFSNARIVKGTAVYTSNFTPSTSSLTAITNTSLLTCQSNRFVDNSSNNFTITPAGDTKVTAFSPFAPSAAYSASTNGGSAFFDGSGDYLTTPSNTAFNFNASDFTVEAWINPSNVSGTKAIMGIFQGGIGGWYFGMNGSSLRFSSGFADYDAGTLVLGAWSHVAATVSSGSLRMFINGVQVNTTTNVSAQNFNITNALWVGNINTTGWTFTGYISDSRVIKGNALYTTNFTPPTAPLTAITNTQLLLNCTNAGIIDNAGKNDIETVGNAQISTSVKKYGTGSMYFDGSGDRLLMGAEATQLSGNFTIEFWAYRLSGGAGWRVCVANYLTWTSGSFFFGGDTGGSGINFGSNNTGDHIITSGSPFPQNTWTHLAAVRFGSTITIYSNGISVGSFTDSTNYSLSQGTIVGGIPGAFPNEFNGYIDDLRITKGQALYTANFTPPTQAFPNQ